MGLLRDVSGVVGAIRGDEERRYRLAERLARRIHPDAILSSRERNWMRDDEFRDVYERFRGGRSHRMMDRIYFLGQLTRLGVLQPGDTAECGCFTGMSSYEICRHSQPGKRHHIFDSFEGVSEPGGDDGLYWEKGDLSASEQTVRTNLDEFDVEYYKGWIPDRFDDVAGRQFCLIHIDVDLYQPTADSLAFFYERVVPGGVIVLDDYGSGLCPGATKAVDEFMSDKPEIVLSVPTAQGCIIKQ